MDRLESHYASLGVRCSKSLDDPPQGNIEELVGAHDEQFVVVVDFAARQEGRAGSALGPVVDRNHGCGRTDLGDHVAQVVPGGVGIREEADDPARGQFAALLDQGLDQWRAAVLDQEVRILASVALCLDSRLATGQDDDVQLAHRFTAWVV
ncbi:hypothetical protein D9M69_588220 [compost metagenome]